jgi:hypothetical protein
MRSLQSQCVARVKGPAVAVTLPGPISLRRTRHENQRCPPMAGSPPAAGVNCPLYVPGYLSSAHRPCSMSIEISPQSTDFGDFWVGL